MKFKRMISLLLISTITLTTLTGFTNHQIDHNLNTENNYENDNYIGVEDSNPLNLKYFSSSRIDKQLITKYEKYWESNLEQAEKYYTQNENGIQHLQEELRHQQERIRVNGYEAQLLSEEQLQEKIIEEFALKEFEDNIETVERFIEETPEEKLEDLTLGTGEPLTYDLYEELVMSGQNYAILDKSINNSELKQTVYLTSSYFPDNQLRTKLAETFGVSEGSNITSKCRSTTTLKIVPYADREIYSITGLEYFTSLRELGLRHNRISNLEPLRNLTTLLWLDLSSNQVSNLEPLRNLNSLEFLDLEHNQVSNLEPLRNLNSLTTLKLHYNLIRDIFPIKELTSLTHLTISRNQISSLYPLRNMTLLTDLYLYENTFHPSDLSNLPYFKGTCRVHLGDIPDPGYYATHLKWVSVNDTTYDVSIKHITTTPSYTGSTITKTYNGQSQVFEAPSKSKISFSPSGLTSSDFNISGTGSLTNVGTLSFNAQLSLTPEAAKRYKLSSPTVSIPIQITKNTQTQTSVSTSTHTITYGDTLEVRANLNNSTLLSHTDLEGNLELDNTVVDTQTYNTNNTTKTITLKPKETGQIALKLTTPGDSNIASIE